MNRTDCGLRAGEPFVSRLISGFPRPRWRILGTELAGTVEAAGAAVTQFAPVTRYSASTRGGSARTRSSCACGSAGRWGPSRPPEFGEAAAVCDGPPGARLPPRGQRSTGPSILVYGASGSIGTAAVQLASYLGADVTAVCSTDNVELVRSWSGPRDRLTRADFRQNGEAYDVVFDAVGMQPFGRCRDSIRPGGAYWRPIICTIRPRRVDLKDREQEVLFPIPPKYAKEDVLFLGSSSRRGVPRRGRPASHWTRSSTRPRTSRRSRRQESRPHRGRPTATSDRRPRAASGQ